MNRREFFLGAATSVSALRAVTAFGQASDDNVILVGTLPPLPPDLASNASHPPAAYEETELVGTAAPSTSEVDTAYQILVDSPFSTSPIEVAQYFLAVGAGAYGSELRQFAREWPVRANPLIFHFFSATQTKPEGDTTAWCAAFLNWCLLRARARSANQIGTAPGYFSKSGEPFSDDDIKNRSTNHASSGSFRCWGVANPVKRGDIVVFANPGTGDLTRVCRGQGHVAFFLGVPRDGWVRVLGGNQTSRGSGGAITVADMPIGPSSRFMKFVAIR